MEELIPFIFFIVWLLFSGVGSKKKREEAVRRQQEARRQAEAERAARAEQRRAGAESRGIEERGSFQEAQPTASSTETSLDMIPDELWDILTGGAPRPTRPGQPQPPPTSQPTSDGGWVTSPPWDEEDAIHSIEGVSTEAEFGDETDYDDEAIRGARRRDTELRDTPWDQKPTSRDAIAVGADETSEGRHVDFHDRLRETEIGDATVSTVTMSASAIRLGLRNHSDVRRAIVLAEILGPPKALR